MNEQDFLQELRKDFLDEATYLLEQCEESYLKLEDPAHRAEELARIFRLAHSIKGGSAVVNLTDLAEFAHIVEDCLSLLRNKPQAITSEIITTLLKAGDCFKERIDMLRRNDSREWNTNEISAELKKVIQKLQTAIDNENLVEIEAEISVQLAQLTRENIPEPGQVPSKAESQSEESDEGSHSNKEGLSSIKVDTERVESVLNLVGELVVIKSQLMNQCSIYAQDLRLASIVSLMDRTIRDLQDKTLSIRMTPLKGLFIKAQRMVRDLSIKLGKSVDFQMIGESTEIDRTMIELLADPLMHMIRNSLDHGIETSDTRVATGKSKTGNILLSAEQLGGQILLRLRDDGAGLNRQAILDKVIAKGLLPKDRAPDTLSDQEVFNFIFLPGFSTTEKVTDLSGRGVGMDIVKTNITKLKGSIQIESTKGHGTTFNISIPITTSITDGMIIEVSQQSYILPTDIIRELITLDQQTLIELSPGKKVFHYRDSVYPIIHLNEVLPSHQDLQTSSYPGMIAIVQVGLNPVALSIDRVLGQTQVVLKPLGNQFHSVKGIAGVAILGDGKVALVLDPQGIFELKGSQSQNASAGAIYESVA